MKVYKNSYRLSATAKILLAFFLIPCLLAAAIPLGGGSFFEGRAYAADAPVNVAAGKTITASDTIMGSTAYVTDGDKNTNNFIGVTQNLQWIQIDLGQSYTINNVNLWHYFGDGRTYRDVIVRLSNSSTFSSGVTTVFNNDANNSAGLGVGSHAEYTETAAGKSIPVNAVSARYVRLYTNGSSSNIYNHYVEVEIWSVTGSTPPPTVSKAMFDDFNYTGASDSNLTAFKWTVREGAGGPGPSGCSWLKSNITFITDPQNASNKLMRLTAATNGTGSGTNQAEIYHLQKYLEGTYAARVRFTDAPLSGSDGDQVNETFFSITPLNYDNDPAYSECDFEYLANGGWGVAGPTMWMTSWETYSNNPWSKDNVYSYVNSSHNGWHTLVFTVSGGQIKYYIDGVLKATHGGNYYPETRMSINFNLWYLAEGLLGAGSTRSYVQDVDWVYHAKGVALTSAQVETNINDYRSRGITRTDNVD